MWMVAEHKRMANYELLRIVAMIMVVILHFLSRSDNLINLDLPLNGVRILGTLLETFCLVAVNTYVLLSGYLGIRSSFKVSRAVGLLCQIWFYTFFIFFIWHGHCYAYSPVNFSTVFLRRPWISSTAEMPPIDPFCS